MAYLRSLYDDAQMLILHDVKLKLYLDIDRTVGIVKFCLFLFVGLIVIFVECYDAVLVNHNDIHTIQPFIAV